MSNKSNTRELALNWWKELSEKEKIYLIENSEFDLHIVNKLVWATGFEIEEMYKNNN